MEPEKEGGLIVAAKVVIQTKEHAAAQQVPEELDNSNLTVNLIKKPVKTLRGQ